ncbi:hypothetical protein ABT346_30420 [Micromonospora peucetia]|uniref:hypothetical protein n=1 Tax=Micromonospora peucetia TaxID=47871 RepID=UPI00332A11D7
MRKIVGLALVLYSILLGFSVSLPLAASIVGPKVSAVTVAGQAACHDAIGRSPLAGFPQHCEVSWTTDEGEATGTLYGRVVDDLRAGSNAPASAVHELGNFAFTAPVGDLELATAFLAPAILFIGLHALAPKRRRRGGGRRHGFDFGGDDGDDFGGGDSGGGGD